MQQRDGQVAVIIGGTGALGAAVALQLAAEGAAIAFTYNSSDAKAQALCERIGTQSGRQAHGAKLAISDAGAVAGFIADVVAEFGGINTLVYAAGPTFGLNFVSQVTPEEFSAVIDADLKGCFNAIHAALPHLRQRKGAIVAITAAAVQRALARDVLSLTPKSAITTLIRHVALEEGRAGIRANCVAPGFIAGGLGNHILESVGPEGAQQIVKGIPMRRTGTSEEVADAVAYLTSARASYITGTTIFVSGGLEL